jgi:hypothetical protein
MTDSKIGLEKAKKQFKGICGLIVFTSLTFGFVQMNSEVLGLSKSQTVKF